MFRRLIALSAASLLLAAGTAIAQETQSDQSGAADLPIGEVVVEPVTTEYDDWIKICYPTDEGGENCALLQVVLNNQNSPIARLELTRIANDPERAAGVIISLPLGVMLQDGILIQVDSALPRRYQYSVCDNGGCYSRFALTRREVDRMKAGNAMTMTIFGYQNPDAPIDLKVSLIGFTAGFDSL